MQLHFSSPAPRAYRSKYNRAVISALRVHYYIYERIQWLATLHEPCMHLMQRMMVYTKAVLGAMKYILSVYYVEYKPVHEKNLYS